MFYVRKYTIINFSDGWDKTNLQEYYKVKNTAKKQKEDAIKKGERAKSRSPSPINFDALGLKSPTVRRYRLVNSNKTERLFVINYFLILKMF